MASGKATKGGVVYDVGSWRLGDDGSIYRYGRLKYSNGDIYDGEWLNGKRHGKGMLKFAEGGSYIGEFGENVYHGFGLLTIPKSQHALTKKWIPGERYEGEFAQGRKHGKGTAKTRDGDSYDGFFIDGYYHGKGTCAYANGDVYDGNWVHGKWQGHGELRFRDGSRYVGEFHQGVYHGFGQFLHGSGGKLGSYVGHYVQGKRHGKGLRVFGSSDKKQYEGEWEEDEPHGVGVVECATYKLVGQFVRGKECGHGAMSFANGESYEGYFEDGFFSGLGTYVHRDGGKYEGHFVKSKRHGKGRRVFANGGQYDGDWADDKMHGRGRLTRKSALPTGKGTLVYEGAFEWGAQTGEAVISFTYTPFDSTTRFEWTDEYEFPLQSEFWHCGRGASTYHGQVLRGNFHGYGVLRSPDGKVWSGEWMHGKMTGVGERIYFPLEVAAILEQERERNQGFQDEENERQVPTLGTNLYKILSYEGEFLENVRHGDGHVLYANGDRVLGPFVKGFAHGVVEYRFAGGGKSRFAEFHHGARARWLTEAEEDAIRAQVREREQAQETETSRQKSIIRALIA
uniref:Uncharacterized protein n=1 Tax=Globisporangium ultimum (strain ATCC 200006 / CBS 805.95 / DAOM BR144) TaxID=431595 RepID=K3X194_GLOUD